MNNSFQPPHSLCIVLPTWVGDACMATPTLRAIRQAFPDSKIVGVMRPVVRDVLEHAWGSAAPWLDEALLYSKKSGPETCSRWGLVGQIRRRGVDVGVLLTNSLWSAAVMRMARVPRIVGYRRDARGWLLSDSLAVPRDGKKLKPISPVDYYLELAAYLGGQVDDRAMQLGTSSQDQQRADRLWDECGFSCDIPTIGINCGAATGTTRLWPEQHVRDLAQRLASELDLQVLLHCGPGEREGCNRLATAIGHPRVASMGCMDQLPIGLSKAALGRCAVVVSTDSGPRHLAVALNRPVVALYGPTDPAWTPTYNRPEMALAESLACRPCYQSPCPLKHHRCMQDLSVERVLAAVRALLVPRAAVA